MLKAVILIGGPQKGTRFRPLSLDIPKPLFPVAGLPLIQHHIEACVSLDGLKEILIIGFYPAAQIQPFVNDMQQLYNVQIKYLQEFTALGTAGGLYLFRDQIRCGQPDAFFVMNGDVCADFPLENLYNFHKQLPGALVSIMSTEATRQQSVNYGCMVVDKNTQEVTHYVEKPGSYISTIINCGVYVFSSDIFQKIGETFNLKQQEYYKNYNGNGNKEAGFIQLEQEILAPLAGTGRMYSLQVSNWWSQLKTAGSAIYANRHYLELFRSKHPERLYPVRKEGDQVAVIPDVFVDSSAVVHTTAVLGPNVSIGPGASIGAGARVKESIVLADAIIGERSLVRHSIIGRESRIGKWARVEGTPSDPDPNKPFAKMENPPLFNSDGRLNPSITILVFEYPVSKESYKRVFTWGNRQTGALGKPWLKDDEGYMKNLNIRQPKRITIGEKCEVTSAACGFGFTAFAINSNTNIKLYGTGINTDSQIGYHEVRSGHPLETIFIPQPIQLPFRNPSESEIIKLSAGRAHLLILTDEGLFCLGNNAYGQCGREVIEDEDYGSSNFINVIPNVDGKKVVDLECGQDHSLAVTEDGAVYSCGWGADGQTGLGHFDSCAQFTRVTGDIEHERIVKIACRSDFVLALNDKGEVFGWGNTEYAQMTLPNDAQQLCYPTHLKMLTKLGPIVDIASGGSFCLVANAEGEVFTWGYGLLGVGPKVQSSKTPLNIPKTLFGRNDFQPNSRVKKVVSGLYYAAAITNLGDLYIWGRNKNGCLGLGHDKDQYFPLKVSLAGYVDQVYCAVDHSVALCKPFV